jgi:hypothetical protein
MRPGLLDGLSFRARCGELADELQPFVGVYRCTIRLTTATCTGRLVSGVIRMACTGQGR